MFSYADIGCGDHQLSTFKYVGPHVTSPICICSVTPSASSLLSAITADQNPVGFVAVTVHEICNPLDYANGREAVTRPIRSFRSQVFRYSDTVVFILFEKANLCVFETVQFIFESIAPERIVVLGSIQAKDFVGEVRAPEVFFLSSNQSDRPRLPAPNTMRHIAAALLVWGEVKNIPVQACQLVEEDSGPTIASMELLAKVVATFALLDVTEIAKHANHIEKIRGMDPLESSL
jgi:hypothetical protein